MAAEHGMIEPFSPDQVRVAHGHRIVSYGTSSYGYDVRCADEFKIFTNINSTIVDPKSFDEKSFVDFKGPVCIIPPNSFALASTVEYFRIPRSVLTVCLGKCVTGDTRVVDADTGSYLPITEMRWGKSTLAWNGRRMQRAKVSAFIPQGRREVFELRTRAGLRIRATANHPFLKLNGWVALSDLRPGDRIAVAREIPVFGKTPVAEGEAARLARKTACDADAGGGAQGTAAGVPQIIFTAAERSVRAYLQALFDTRGGIKLTEHGAAVDFASRSRRVIDDVHHLLLRFGIFSRLEIGATTLAASKLEIVDEDQVRRFAQRVGFIAGSAQQVLLEERLLCSERARAGVGAAHLQPSGLHGALHAAGPIWDAVERIEPQGAEDVFDLTVPGLHNFVANDFIVHNSTYARCFRGDTRVALVDGTAPSLEEMARRHESGELFWGYSIGPNGSMIVALLDVPRFIGRDRLLELQLDNGECVRATPDHLFMRRDGRMAEAHALRPGDTLMPLYRDLARGYEMVYQPIDGSLYPTDRLAHEWNLANKILAEIPERRAAVAADPGQRRASQAEIARRRGTPAYRNHKLLSVRELPGDHDVYCLTVPEAGNFALEAGVFVHNCGIIVNVTPLEPEWEGHVTLEFSNTTPLPAKIYADEGVAQMLFFESDEVCETSYKDRGGKYQGQRGVTLPKT